MICSECGKEFEKRYQHQKTCSPECQKVRDSRLKREIRRAKEGMDVAYVGALRHCVECGKLYVVQHQKQLTCSDKCQNERVKRQIRERSRSYKSDDMMGRGSPCQSCDRAFSTSCKCNEWQLWFLEAWDEVCERLRR